jgi:hypothetical protein
LGWGKVGVLDRVQDGPLDAVINRGHCVLQLLLGEVGWLFGRGRWAEDRRGLGRDCGLYGPGLTADRLGELSGANCKSSCNTTPQQPTCNLTNLFADLLASLAPNKAACGPSSALANVAAYDDAWCASDRSG